MNQSCPIISFIIPAFKARWIGEAVSSILDQTFKEIELIVVDDCSPENLKEIVGTFEDERIRYFRNVTNLGGKNLVDQWNHCLEFASGEWVVMAGDDDVYAPEFASEIVRLSSAYPQVDLIRTRVEQIGENGRHIWDDGVFEEYSTCYQYLNDWLTAKAFTCVGNFAFRRSVLMALGGFISFPSAFNSDVATPIALAANGVANTSDMLFKFRQSSLHLSGNPAKYEAQIEATSLLYEWLEKFEYGEPVSEEDVQAYSIKNHEYLHAKCIYDYFNLVVVNVPLRRLPHFLSLCRLAGAVEKGVMVLRWIKRRING